MTKTENVVPSKLYTTEGASSKKQSKEELEYPDPEKAEGLAIVSGASKGGNDDTNG